MQPLHTLVSPPPPGPMPYSDGAVRTVAGKHNINIYYMKMGRLSPRGQAMMVLGLDNPVPLAVMQEIQDWLTSTACAWWRFRETLNKSDSNG